MKKTAFQKDREHKRMKAVCGKLHRVLAGAVLAAGLILGAPNVAKADSIELMAGNKSTTIDLKAAAEINKKLGVFMRVRPTVDYHGNVSAFGVADLTINIRGALDAVAEVQVLGGKVVPRAGAQYFAKTGDFSVYALATMGLDKAPYLETLAVIRFAPALHRNLRLLAQVENITDVRPKGHDFSTQRIRLGVERNGWGVGAAGDLTETGNRPKHADGTFGWNVGGFIMKKF